MANIVQVEAQNLVNGWLGIAAYTAAATPMKLSLHTGTASATAAGTEVTGGPGPYARQTIAFGSPSAATPSVATNSGAVSFTGMPVATVTDINIYDSTGTPVRRAFGTLTASKTTASGDTLSFAIGAVSASIG
jgi:hypothetical protein